MSADFNNAVEAVKSLSNVSQGNLLKMYGLYKQATVGDVNIRRPGMFDLKGRAKWDAWNEIKGMAKEAAEQEYAQLAKELGASW